MTLRFLPYLFLALSPLCADEMWVELGPSPNGFSAIARYAPSAAECPAIQIDSRSLAMTRRAPTGTFAALVCEAVIPSGTTSASINGQALPLPAWTLKQH